MSSSFILRLDTTGPEIQIFAPSYTISSSLVEMFIESNEELLVYQDIYIVDARGNVHPQIFLHEGSGMYGVVDFSNFHPGIATVYARLKDIVGNDSNIAVHHINVLPSTEIIVDVSEKSREAHIRAFNRKTDIRERRREINVREADRYVKIDEQNRGTEVNDIDAK